MTECFAASPPSRTMENAARLGELAVYERGLGSGSDLAQIDQFDS